MSRPWYLKRHANIYLYLPNLIGSSSDSLNLRLKDSALGYLRLFCSLYAFYLSPNHPYLCVLFYLVGFICDDLDGRVARFLDQTSVLGVVLDMVTDRLSTAGLFVLLAMMYQDWFFLFLLLLMLDISSHWSQMYYVLTTGKTTHKEVTSKSWLVRSYYRHRIFMGICCISCEVLYLSLYLMHWTGLPDVEFQFASFPLFNLTLSIPKGVRVLRVGSVFWVALLVFPGFLMKQVINVFQLRNAMIGLVRHDLMTRSENSKVH